MPRIRVSMVWVLQILTFAAVMLFSNLVVAEETVAHPSVIVERGRLPLHPRILLAGTILRIELEGTDKSVVRVSLKGTSSGTIVATWYEAANAWVMEWNTVGASPGRYMVALKVTTMIVYQIGPGKTTWVPKDTLLQAETIEIVNEEPCEWISPQLGAQLVGPTQVSLHPRAERRFQSVTFLLDGKPVATDKQEPWETNIDVPSLDPGPHALTASIVRTESALYESLPRSFIVPERVRLTVQESQGNGQMSGSEVAVDVSLESQLLKLQAVPVEALPVESVEFQVNDSRVATFSQAPYVWEWDIGRIPSGIYNATCILADNFGYRHRSQPLRIRIINRLLDTKAQQEAEARRKQVQQEVEALLRKAESEARRAEREAARKEATAEKQLLTLREEAERWRNDSKAQQQFRAHIAAVEAALQQAQSEQLENGQGDVTAAASPSAPPSEKQQPENGQVSSGATPQPVPKRSGPSLSAIEINRRYGVAVVMIGTSKAMGMAQGSGFVVRSDGIIATNYHVIEGAGAAIVRFASGQMVEVIALLSVDRGNDLALLQVNASSLPPVSLGNSDIVELGEDLVVIGNPQGLANSVTKGILSGRRVIEGEDLLQIDAPISAGSSGGPVFNSRGEVIGVVVASLVSGQNINFAVPINYLNSLLQ